MVHFAIYQATRYEKTTCLLTLLNQYGDTPWPKNKDLTMVHYAIHQATRYEKTTCLLTLLNQYGDTPWPKNKDLTMVHYAISLAARQGKIDCLFTLLNRYGDTRSPSLNILEEEEEEEEEEGERWTAVHFAIYQAAVYGQTKCLLSLLSKYKDTPWPEYEHSTMVDFAIITVAKYGKINCLLRLLNQYGQIAWPGEEGWTMVHNAIFTGIENNQISCVEKVLIKYKYTPWPGMEGWTIVGYAIHEAAKYGKTDCLKQLLTNHGNSPCPKYKNGSTLYHFGLDRLKHFGKVTQVEYVELLHWIKERLINDFHTRNTPDQTKQQIEALIDLNKALKIEDYQSLYHEFFNRIYPRNQDPRFYQAINVSPMSLLCELIKIGSPLNLPRVAPFAVHVAESPIDELIFIREHLSECFLWKYDPLVNKLNEFIQEYRQYGPYNHQSNQNDTGARIINQTSSHISKLIRKMRFFRVARPRSQEKTADDALFLYWKQHDLNNSR